MPELPEVQALVEGLSARMTGRHVARCELASFSALKTVTPALDELTGRVVTGVERRGKYLCVHCDSLWMVAHLSRGGWVRWYDELPARTARPGRGPMVLRAGLDDASGFEITEMGTEKRVALWVVGASEEVAAVARLGIDPLEIGFTVGHLSALMQGGSATLKTALTDQTLIAGVGNAYSDEALHRARLSPYKKTTSLTRSELDRLHDALTGVLTEAVERASAVELAELKGDKKRAMHVHGRAGEPCPVCGDTIRQVSFAARSMQYCPTCQTGGRPLADRRLSRLLR